jgi:hypothetical protein
MTDDANDARDERMAARLTVEPLDDVTRARLVRNALSAAEPEAAPDAQRARRSPAPVRWLAVAAILVVLLAVGVAALVSNGSDSAPTAARDSKTAARPPSRIEVTPNAAPQADSQLNGNYSISAVQTLGDLGDVSTAAELRRAVTAALPAHAQTLDQAERAAVPSASASSDVPKLIPADCPAHPTPPAGTTIAVGEGTVGGKPVSVSVVERADGTRVAYASRDGCVVGKLVPL